MKIKLSSTSDGKIALEIFEILLCIGFIIALIIKGDDRGTQALILIFALFIVALMVMIIYNLKQARSVILEKNKISMYSAFNRELGSVDTTTDVFFELINATERSGNSIKGQTIPSIKGGFVILSNKYFKPFKWSSDYLLRDLCYDVDEMENAVLVPYSTKIGFMLKQDNFHSVLESTNKQ